MAEGEPIQKKEFGIGILRGNLLWLVICQCIWMFTTNIPSPYLPLYIQKLGGSPADIGLVKSAATLWGLNSAIQGGVNMILAVPAGKLMDKLRRKKLLVALMTVTPIFPIAFLFIKDYWVLVIMVVAVAVCNAFLMPGFQSILADYTPRERRRVTSAVGSGNFFIDIRDTTWGCGMLLFIPLAVGQTLGGLLYETNPAYPFIIMSAGHIPIIIWACLKINDPRTIER